MIIVYNKELDNFHEITHAVSVQMVEYYNAIGKATLVLPIDDYNISIIENDGIIYDTDRDVSFVIKNYKYDTKQNRITINCYTSNWLLNKRVVATEKKIQNVESDLLDMVSENLRGLYRTEVSEPSGIGGTTDLLLHGKQLLDQVMPVLEAKEFGNRMRWDTERKTHVFEVYKGRDLTNGIHAVVFSEEQGTADDLVFSVDDSLFKNYIYVPGEKKNGEKVVVEVGSKTAEDRNERWMTGSFNQEEKESDVDFMARLEAVGLDEIARLVSKTTFSVVIDPTEYGIAYKMGDLVSCVSYRFGVELKSRITGVKYTLDTNGEKISLILGSPVLTAIKEVYMNG